MRCVQRIARVNIELVCVCRILGAAEAYVACSLERIMVGTCARSQLVRRLIPRASAYDAKISRSGSPRVVYEASAVIGWVPPILHPLSYVATKVFDAFGRRAF